MSKLTKYEQRFTKKVRDFMSRTDCDLSTIGNSKEVHYSNVEKLNEYIVDERGTITQAVAGRIVDYIDNYGKKSPKKQNPKSKIDISNRKKSPTKKKTRSI